MAISHSNYKILETLNETNNYYIYRVLYQDNTFLLKKIKKNMINIDSIASLKREFHLLENLSLNSNSIPKPVLLLNEFEALFDDFNGLPLDKLIKNKFFSLELFLTASKTIISNLDYLHKNSIVFNNLKPKNILYNTSDNSIQFINFEKADSLTEVVVSNDILSVEKNTLFYISPEQTGRINRKLDYRSDYYSIGIIFYEILSGKIPFYSKDPLEIIHSHIAKMPTHLYDLDCTIPTFFSKVIFKLIAKNPEERYQSCKGILYDLELCFKHLNSKNELLKTEVGSFDISNIFHVSQKIYGRNNEISMLLRAYESSKNNSSSIILVEGFSGIGKSSLVNEIYKPITRDKGLFISGKFDVLKRDIPYFPFIEAFKTLINQTLSLEKKERDSFAKLIQNNLASNGKLITTIIPELIELIGEQEEVSELPLSESLHRFSITFKNFIKSFLSKPLVIFIDDLQWCDSPSLTLIQLMMVDNDINNLYLITAYRNNEIYKGHPFSILLDELRENGIYLPKISLEPLSKNDVTNIIKDSFKTDPELAQKLGEFCYDHSLGNPFEVNHLLKYLYKKKFLSFNLKNGKWNWDLATIKLNIKDQDTSMLINNSIKEYDNSTLEILKIAACIGNNFDTKILSTISDKKYSEIDSLLWQPIKDGIVIPINDSYQLIKYESSINAPYSFFHDKIYFACYSLLSENEKEELHLKIADLLLKSTDVYKNEEMIYMITNHYNKIIKNRALFSNKKRADIAKLNLKAGLKAKKSAAYVSALKYFKASNSLLDNSYWIENYSFMITLYTNICESSYIVLEYNDMQSAYDTINKHSKTILDIVPASEVIIQSYVAKNSPIEAVDKALDLLLKLNINIKKDVNPLTLLSNLTSIQKRVKFKNIDSLVRLPDMKNLESLAAIRIMVSILAAAFVLNKNLYILLVLKMTNLSLKQGNSPYSAVAYANYGLIMSAAFYKIKSGYKFGNVALKLIDKYNAKELEANVYMIYNTTIKYYIEPLDSTYSQLIRGYGSGVESGDLEYATYDLAVYGYNSFFAGKNLDLFYKEMSNYRSISQNLKQEIQSSYLSVFSEVSKKFKNGWDFKTISNDIFTEEEMITFYKNAKNNHGLFNLYLLKMILSYYYKDYSLAYNFSIQAKKYIDAALGFIVYPEFIFYDTLIKLKIVKKFKGIKKKALIATIKVNKIKLYTWSKNSPENFLHKLKLVKAEEYGSKNMIKSIKFYNSAINLAHKNGYIQEEALASELASSFCYKNEQNIVAEFFLKHSIKCYKEWGADKKVFELSKNTNSIENRSLDNKRDNYLNVDLLSLIKVSNTLSSDLRLDIFIENILETLLENAGAQKSILIIESENEFFIEGIKNLNNNETTILSHTPIEKCDLIPLNLIKDVINKKETILYGDAKRESNVLYRDYIDKNNLKSLLAMPLINKDGLHAILYFENSLTLNAFSKDRVETITLLSSAIIILLENSKLYTELMKSNDTLEIKIKERTLELEKSKEIAESATKLKSDFLSNMSHEIRTPLNGVIGLSYLMKNSELDNKQLDYMNKIEESANHLLNLINNILDFSKIEAGKMELDSSNFTLKSILDFLSTILFKNIEDKKINLLIDIAEDIPIDLLGDSHKLKQVLLNLAANAIKFTEKGKVKISCKLLKKNENSVDILFSIKDSGIGMTNEQKNRLFNSFSQADSSITKKYGGTGLGLAISKNLIELMGGSIRVESEYGKGSEFYFVLPLKYSDIKEDIIPIPKPKLAPIQIEGSKKFSGLKFLIAEDNQINQQVLTDILSSWGGECSIASDGNIATSLIKNTKYDIVFMDVNMPNKNGHCATKEVRLFDNDTIIVALTANTSPEEIKKCFDSGMNEFLYKPIKPDALSSMIEKFHPLSLQVYIEEEKEESELPKIYGIDVSEGIDRVLGNKEAFYKFLLSFCDSYKDFENTIHSMIKDKDYNLIKQYIHEIKGVSGNISASKIYRLTESIESLDFATEYERLVESLKELTKEIDLVLQNRVFLENSLKSPNKTIPENNTIISLIDLKNKLIVNNYDAHDTFNCIDPNDPNISSDNYDAIKKYINTFNYDKALNLVNSILDNIKKS